MKFGAGGFRKNQFHSALFLGSSIIIWFLSSCSLVEGVDVFDLSRHPFNNNNNNNQNQIMEISDIPQFVTITFDDDVTPTVVNLFSNLVNGIRDDHRRNSGCGIKTTFFVSFENSIRSNAGVDDTCQLINALRRGQHEIATSTYNATANPTIQDIQAAIDFLVEECDVPREELRGFRSPNLPWTQDIPLREETLQHLTELGGFLYDSSMKVEDYIGSDYGRNHTWPFTLDTTNIQNFFETKTTPTPDDDDDTTTTLLTSNFPGLWEIPMYPFYNIDNTLNQPMDYHNHMDSSITMTAKIQDNFQRRYYGNRAPLGLYFHGSWLSANGNELRNWINFVLATYNDVYFVTNQELIEYMNNPVPKTQYQSTCDGQVIDCFPPDGGSCVFGTFDAESCDCYCDAPYCKDETGACTRVCTAEENPPPGSGGGGDSGANGSGGSDGGGGGGSSQFSELDQRCCPGGYSGNRPYDECRKFYACANGQIRELTNSFECGNGLLFDARQGTCLWGNDVTCTISVDNADECGSLQETISPTSSPSLSWMPSTQPTSYPTSTPTSSQQPSLLPTQAPIYDYEAADEYLTEKRELNLLALLIGVGVAVGVGLFLLYGVYVHKLRKKNAQSGQSS